MNVFSLYTLKLLKSHPHPPHLKIDILLIGFSIKIKLKKKFLLFCILGQKKKLERNIVRTKHVIINRNRPVEKENKTVDFSFP